MDPITRRQLIAATAAAALADVAQAVPAPHPAAPRPAPFAGPDDSPALQAAIDAAARTTISAAATPRFPGWSAAVRVTFSPGKYRIGTPINVPADVDLVADGQTWFESINGCPDCFIWPATAYRLHICGLGFVGFSGRCLAIDTANRDTARIVVERCTSYGGILLDTVSYPSSRSTVADVRDCTLIAAQLRLFTDVSRICSCWFTHSGRDQAMLTLDSFATIDSCVFVPQGNPTDAPDRRWIDWHASDLCRPLTCRGTRFGAEAGGGIPIVYARSAGNNRFLADDGQQLGVRFEDCAISTLNAPPRRRAAVVLFDIPNYVSFARCSGGISPDGLVVTADDSIFVPAPPATSMVPMFSIDVDTVTRRTQRQMTQPLVSPDLERYVIAAT